tara:strand:+ start:6749 stop:7156 length:408 start_codon:yes stop_codon:yes gene_type:complete
MMKVNRETHVSQFHSAMGLPIDAQYTVELLELRKNLLLEEVNEYNHELDVMAVEVLRHGRPHLETQARHLKELADIQYIISGNAVTFGCNLQAAFNRVHSSNMSKLGEDGKPIYREDGKVLKGPNYKAPNLIDLV